MEPTQRMYEVMKEHDPAARNLLAGLATALKDVPDTEPFAFPGYPDNQVYFHPCGTVQDLAPGPSEMRACVERGDCDCGSGASWLRVYVEKPR